ncbi:MAG: helix-turn-helix transcriptional regulator [Dermatophilaceae bacterium]
MPSQTRELLKGAVPLLVLAVLASEDGYGYQIKARIEALTDGAVALTDGTLYPALHALEREGLVVGYWEDGSSARRRRYYQLTYAGTQSLRAQRLVWSRFAAAVESVLSTTD